MKKLLMITCLLATLGFGSAAMAEGTFEDLTDLGTSFFGHYLTLSFDGTAFHANATTYWSEGTGYLTAAEGSFSRITGDGMKVVGSVNDPGIGAQTAGVWDPATDTWLLVDPIPGGEPCGSFMSGYAGNFDGTMVTGLAWRANCDAVAFLWTEGEGTLDLGRNDDEDRSSRGSDISDDGTTVGGFFENNACGRRNAIWVNAGLADLFLGEDSCGEVLGVNSDGSMICGRAPGEFGIQEAYYYDTTVGYVHIGTLPSDEFNGSTALGIADNSTVVGFNSDSFFGFPEAFVWTPEDGLMSFSDFLDLNGVPYPDGAHFYNCTDVSADGNTFVGSWLPEGGAFFQAFKVVLGGVVSNEDVDEDVETEGTPSVTTQLLGAYPNPFNPMTTVKFTLERDQNVRLSVFDMNGRRVAQLADGVFAAGTHPIVWNGKDMGNRSVASGTYVIKMESEESVQTKTMTLVR